MFTSNLVKNILSGLLLVGVVFLSYRYVTRPLTDPNLEMGIEVVSGEESSLDTSNTTNIANVFSNLLDKLATVDFQKGNTIFDNPIFQNGLIGFSRQLPEIDITRSNPFAPIEGNPALYIRYAPPAVIPPVSSTTAKILPGQNNLATTSVV